MRYFVTLVRTVENETRSWDGKESGKRERVGERESGEEGEWGRERVGKRESGEEGEWGRGRAMNCWDGRVQ